MISVYWFCFLFGGIFVALAAVGGLDHDFGHDFDSDFDHSFDAEAAVEPDVAADVDLPEPPSSGRRLWLPITSFKFWTFGLCFFGMTGLLLGWLNPNLPGSLQLGLAIAMGLLLGTGMAGLLRQLRNRRSIVWCGVRIWLVPAASLSCLSMPKAAARCSWKSKTV
uniref:Uncharacterized protein n=1 Tax=Synechococcus elongatus (strain ATCC 33912 / PCC 7942 / FACHB-805) TaxID=1140 RepID=Q935X1_SYNE7|nr:unknown [Synechococcus elongatus PCC 7942 = FACHB-805]